MKREKQIRNLLYTAALMAIGLLIFKFIPMKIFGNDILFDASFHITLAIFILYVTWYFIDQNKNWHLPFFIFSLAVILVVSFQRIAANAHNDIGLLLGLGISVLAIIIPRWREFRKKISF